MTTFNEILDVAKAERWSRKKVRTAMYQANDPDLWARRDEMLQELGLPTMAEVAQKRQRDTIEKARIKTLREQQELEEREAKECERRRISGLRQQSEREQREAKESELKAYREKERAEIEKIEPH